MMQKQLKIWHAALALWILLLILRIELIFQLLTQLTSLNAGEAAELILFITLPLITFLLHKKLPVIKVRVRFYSLFILVLSFMFIFPGIITGTDPDFRKDLSVTKLLSPFTTVKVLHLRDGSMVFADSIRYETAWVYYQGEKPFSAEEKGARFTNGVPEVNSKTYFLGTDILGRDVFARLVYGARTSLSIGIAAALLSFIFGTAAGFIAGYYQGAAGMILGRTVDSLLSFPVIILIILIVALFGNSLSALILILGFTGWMGLFKIVRLEVALIKTKDYFITSKLIGAGPARLIVKDALPVFIVPALTNVVFQVNNVIIAESSLSYLGLGVENLYPSWGAMIQSGQEYINSAWWLMLFPGLMIILTLLSIKGMGERVNAYFNPGLTRDK